MDLEKQVEINQEYKGQERSFDPDSSPIAWEHYKLIYKDILKIYEGQKIYRRIYWLRMKGGSSVVTMGADTDFTFNCSKLKSEKSPYNMFRAKTNSDSNLNDIEKNRIINLIDECAKKHHSLFNFSIMPQTGGMNLFKRDYRFDWFIYELNKFYIKIANLPKRDYESIIKSDIKLPARGQRESHNVRLLIEYLLKFDGIESYCLKIYQIDSNFTRKLIDFTIKIKRENGHCALLNGIQVKEYCDLALKYFEIRKCEFAKIYETIKKE